MTRPIRTPWLEGHCTLAGATGTATRDGRPSRRHQRRPLQHPHPPPRRRPASGCPVRRHPDRLRQRRPRRRLRPHAHPAASTSAASPTPGPPPPPTQRRTPLHPGLRRPYSQFGAAALSQAGSVEEAVGLFERYPRRHPRQLPPRRRIRGRRTCRGQHPVAERRDAHGEWRPRPQQPLRLADDGRHRPAQGRRGLLRRPPRPHHRAHGGRRRPDRRPVHGPLLQRPRDPGRDRLVGLRPRHGARQRRRARRHRQLGAPRPHGPGAHYCYGWPCGGDRRPRGAATPGPILGPLPPLPPRRPGARRVRHRRRQLTPLAVRYLGAQADAS